MKIAITSDSVIDLTKELLEKYDIKIKPFSFLLGDEEYVDGDITTNDIFEYVSKTGVLPKTSAVNEVSFTEFFEETLKEYDAVIHFDISGDMSTTFNNARLASQNFDGKVEVIDSKALSTGVALLAIYARKLTQTESDIKVIAEKVRSRIKNLQVSFVIERLDYLHKGGRCSSLQLLGANILKVRPKIAVKEGKMGMAGSYRGPMPAVIAKYCKDVILENPNADKSVLFITYSSATPEMLKAVHEAVDGLGFENVYETKAGCTVSCHCGPNTLGIIFLNNANA